MLYLDQFSNCAKIHSEVSYIHLYLKFYIIISQQQAKLRQTLNDRAIDISFLFGKLQLIQTRMSELLEEVQQVTKLMVCPEKDSIKSNKEVNSNCFQLDFLIMLADRRRVSGAD